MSWAEFQIRTFAFKRSNIREYEKMRELMWITYIAPHLDPKKMAKRKEMLFSLPTDKQVSNSAISEVQKQNFLNAYQIYLNSKKLNS